MLSNNGFCLRSTLLFLVLDSTILLLVLETSLHLYILRVCVAAVHSAIFSSKSTHQYTSVTVEVTRSVMYMVCLPVLHIVLHAVVNETCQKARRAWRNGKVLSQCFQIHMVYLLSASVLWHGLVSRLLLLSYTVHMSVSVCKGRSMQKLEV